VGESLGGIEGTVLVKMMASAEGGTSKVKEEPGERAHQTMAEPTATTPTKPDTNVRPKTQQQMFPPPPPLVGLPQPNAATASAMASMLASFPGGFDPAAFAKAAAAAFPGGLPKLAAAPPALVPFPAAATPATTTSTANIKPATKRRKRGRAGEGEDGEAMAGVDAKAEGGAAGGAANGGPLLAKLAEQPPGAAIPPQQAGGAGGKGGVWPSTGAGGGGATTISVLTPNLFGDDMSNQERKVSPVSCWDATDGVFSTTYVDNSSQNTPQFELDMSIRHMYHEQSRGSHPVLCAWDSASSGWQSKGGSKKDMHSVVRPTAHSSIGSCCAVCQSCPLATNFPIENDLEATIGQRNRPADGLFADHH